MSTSLAEESSYTHIHTHVHVHRYANMLKTTSSISLFTFITWAILETLSSSPSVVVESFWANVPLQVKNISTPPHVTAHTSLHISLSYYLASITFPWCNSKFCRLGQLVFYIAKGVSFWQGVCQRRRLYVLSMFTHMLKHDCLHVRECTATLTADMYLCCTCCVCPLQFDRWRGRKRSRLVWHPFIPVWTATDGADTVTPLCIHQATVCFMTLMTRSVIVLRKLQLLGFKVA